MKSARQLCSLPGTERPPRNGPSFRHGAGGVKPRPEQRLLDQVATSAGSRVDHRVDVAGLRVARRRAAGRRDLGASCGPVLGGQIHEVLQCVAMSARDRATASPESHVAIPSVAHASRGAVPGKENYPDRLVRRDAGEDRDVGPESARCASPVGAIPTPVGVGAPGSRVAAAGEIPSVEAGRRKPLRGKRPYGPQREVKPAASTDEQPGSRAAHVTAKATSGALVPKRAPGPGGVRGAARTEGGARNTRGPSSQPSSRRASRISHRVKASRAERESEGDRSSADPGGAERSGSEGSLLWTCRMRSHA